MKVVIGLMCALFVGWVIARFIPSVAQAAFHIGSFGVTWTMLVCACVFAVVYSKVK